MTHVDRLFIHRMDTAFPWPVWLAGWLALLKGLIWLSTDPNLPDPQLMVLGVKHSLFMIPFVACAFGAWKLKRWAGWTLVALCGLELVFFIIYPPAISALALNNITAVTFLFSGAVFLVNGPAGAILILSLVPALLRHAEKHKSKKEGA
ncbi:MAG: hypothetical protein ACOZBW_06055 [Thermodesulfobacteriota bacterium]